MGLPLPLTRCPGDNSAHRTGDTNSAHRIGDAAPPGRGLPQPRIPISATVFTILGSAGVTGRLAIDLLGYGFVTAILGADSCPCGDSIRVIVQKFMLAADSTCVGTQCTAGWPKHMEATWQDVGRGECDLTSGERVGLSFLPDSWQG